MFEDKTLEVYVELISRSFLLKDSTFSLIAGDLRVIHNLLQRDGITDNIRENIRGTVNMWARTVSKFGRSCVGMLDNPTRS